MERLPLIKTIRGSSNSVPHNRRIKYLKSRTILSEKHRPKRIKAQQRFIDESENKSKLCNLSFRFGEVVATYQIFKNSDAKNLNSYLFTNKQIDFGNSKLNKKLKQGKKKKTKFISLNNIKIQQSKTKKKNRYSKSLGRRESQKGRLKLRKYTSKEREREKNIHKMAKNPKERKNYPESKGRLAEKFQEFFEKRKKFEIDKTRRVLFCNPIRIKK
jgi:hypothetical protein